MTLQNIDKLTYRKRLNIVIACAIVTLLVFALGTSTLLIQLVGNQNGSNFVLNLVGVIFAGLTVGIVLYRIRKQPYMAEVVYVWQLKQELNVIYRHSAKLKRALEHDDHNALIINLFNLKGSIQLYELDDNDLTLENLRHEIAEFEKKLEYLDVDISTEDYSRDLLNQLSS